MTLRELLEDRYKKDFLLYMEKNNPGFVKERLEGSLDDSVSQDMMWEEGISSPDSLEVQEWYNNKDRTKSVEELREERRAFWRSIDPPPMYKFAERMWKDRPVDSLMDESTQGFSEESSYKEIYDEDALDHLIGTPNDPILDLKTGIGLGETVRGVTYGEKGTVNKVMDLLKLVDPNPLTKLAYDNVAGIDSRRASTHYDEIDNTYDKALEQKAMDSKYFDANPEGITNDPFSGKIIYKSNMEWGPYLSKFTESAAKSWGTEETSWLGLSAPIFTKNEDGTYNMSVNRRSESPLGLIPKVGDIISKDIEATIYFDENGLPYFNRSDGFGGASKIMLDDTWREQGYPSRADYLYDHLNEKPIEALNPFSAD